MDAPEAVEVRPPDPYATHIPDRRPEFKTHRGLGQAKNALLNKHYGKFPHDMVIYRLNDSGQYEPWLKVSAGTTRMDYEDLKPKPTPKRQIQYRIAWKQRMLEQFPAEEAKIREEIAELQALL